MNSEVLLELKDMTYRYVNEEPLFQNFNFTVRAGEWLMLTGSSGSGKTTLLSLMSSLSAPQQGGVFLNGKNFQSFSDVKLSRVRAQSFGFLFQNYLLLPFLNVTENILYRKEHVDDDFLKELMNDLEIIPIQFQQSSVLSGGQAQRVALIRSLLHRPLILFADEPTAALDQKNTMILMQTLQKAHQGGVTIVMVTHDESLYPYATRLVSLENGQIISIQDQSVALDRRGQLIQPINRRLSVWDQFTLFFKNWFLSYLKPYVKELILIALTLTIGLNAFLISLATVTTLRRNFDAQQRRDDNEMLSFFNQTSWQGWSSDSLKDFEKMINGTLLTAHEFSECSLTIIDQWQSQYIQDVTKVSYSLLPDQTRDYFLKTLQLEAGQPWTFEQIHQRPQRGWPVLMSDQLYQRVHDTESVKTTFDRRHHDYFLFCPELGRQIPLKIQGLYNSTVNNLEIYGQIIGLVHHHELDQRYLSGSLKVAVPMERRSFNQLKWFSKKIQNLLNLKSPEFVVYRYWIPMKDEAADLLFFLIQFFGTIFSFFVVIVTVLGLLTIQVSKIERSWQIIGIQRTLGLTRRQFALQLYLESFLIGCSSLLLAKWSAPYVIRWVNLSLLKTLSSLKSFSFDEAVMTQILDQFLWIGFGVLVSIMIVISLWPLHLIQKIDLGRLLRR